MFSELKCFWVFLFLALMQKNPKHCRPYTTGFHHCSWASPRDVPKSSKALQGICTTISGGNWMKMVWKICVWCTWTKLTFLCFLAFTQWSLVWWAREKPGCCLPGKSQACFDGIDSERVSTSCLAHRCVFRRQSESESWKTDNVLSFVLVLIAHLAVECFCWIIFACIWMDISSCVLSSVP